MIKYVVPYSIFLYLSVISCSTSAEGSSSSAAADSVSAAATEKLKAQLLQKQSDLTGALQAFEEYKEITK